MNDQQSPRPASLMSLADAMPLLASPDSKARLTLADASQLRSEDGSESFPLRASLPMLFPRRFQPYLGENTLEFPLQVFDDPVIQYGLLTSIKHREGFPNSPHDSPWYYQHIGHVKSLVAGAVGTVLDVGCDAPAISSGMFSDQVRYIGLDPLFYNKSDFRLIGMAEYLPVASASFDNVCLLSSLDHILDYHLAIGEAWRALRPGGTLFMQILVWTHNAEVAFDRFHFHHFREYEILGALSQFRIKELFRTSWKDNDHRTSLYIAAEKQG